MNERGEKRESERILGRDGPGERRNISEEVSEISLCFWYLTSVLLSHPEHEPAPNIVLNVQPEANHSGPEDFELMLEEVMNSSEL